MQVTGSARGRVHDRRRRITSRGTGTRSGASRGGLARTGLAVAFCAMLVLPACAGGDPAPPPPPQPAPTQPEVAAPEPAAVLDSHGVSAGDPLAAEAGTAILDAGGTAADAAVATAFAISVVEPYASGIGGGGSALVAAQDGTREAFDFREVVPADGVVPPSETGIPGFVAGMAELHAEHGVLEWSALLEPAARLAEQGTPVRATLVERLTAGSGSTAAGLEQFAPGGSLLQVGDTLVQPELAATLRGLQAEGPDSFYRGPIATQLSDAGVDAASLEGYEVQRNTPVEGPVGDYRVVSSAPALPGAALVQMLQVLEARDVAAADPESADYVALQANAWVLAEQTIRTDLGDLAFTEVPVAELVDPARNSALAGEDPVAEPPPGGEGDVTAPGNTTHLTVVDSDGTMVSMTNTLTEFFGSGTEVGGFFLNDALSRFGTIDSPQNQPEAGRRSVTWSNPTLVLDEQGRPLLGIGTPGGENIVPVLANALTRRLLLDQSLEQAVEAPRFRYDSGTRTLGVESALVDSPATQGASARGWQVSPVDQGAFGSIQSLEIDYGARTVSGPSDPRRDAATVVTEAP